MNSVACYHVHIFFDKMELQLPIGTQRKFWNVLKPKLVSYISVLKVNTIVQSRHPVIVFNGDPEFELTFEKDFRIHELLVVFFLTRFMISSRYKIINGLFVFIY